MSINNLADLKLDPVGRALVHTVQDAWDSFWSTGKGMWAFRYSIEIDKV